MNLHWKRRLVPKWSISSDKPIVFGNDARAAARPEFLTDDNSRQALEKALSDFEKEPSVGLAADALRFAIAKEYVEDLCPVARYLTRFESGRLPYRIAQLARMVAAGHAHPTNIASHITEPDGLESLKLMQRQQLKELRQSVRAYPHNALAWMDIARLQSSMGNNEAAKRHVSVAQMLAPNNRFILRSSARFFAHIDEPDRALRLIQNSQRTLKDPWLMASEIALSSIAGRASKMVRRGRELLDSRRFAAADTAELAGALAVEEITKGGSRKSARNLYIESLIAPNDNALAQVLWAAEDLNLEDRIPSQWLDVPESAEAALYRAMTTGDIDLGLKKALCWHLDEPFASRPMTIASFLASLKADYLAASKFAQLGLIGEPENKSLLNNLGFSLLCEGKIEQATSVISKTIRLHGSRQDPHIVANIGFLAYLCGDSEFGRRAYAESIRNFDKAMQRDEAAMAQICHAFAAKEAADSTYLELKARAVNAAKNIKSAMVKQAAIAMLGAGSNDVGLLLNKIESDLIKKWRYDHQQNILYLKKYIERT